VFIVSPTYEGACADVDSVARACRGAGVPLVVDEAHGAHLTFLRPQRSMPSSEEGKEQEGKDGGGQEEEEEEASPPRGEEGGGRNVRNCACLQRVMEERFVLRREARGSIKNTRTWRTLVGLKVRTNGIFACWRHQRRLKGCADLYLSLQFRKWLECTRQPLLSIVLCAISYVLLGAS